MKRRSAAPWKKSRTYGDIFGGRVRRRMTDDIFARAHSLQRPAAGQHLPILLEDNPSRDFHFPASAAEFADALAMLSASHREGITHIWLRRPHRQYGIHAPLAEFICDSSVRVIVFYPWRTDGQLPLGRQKPNGQVISHLRRYSVVLQQRKASWIIHFEAQALRRLYLELLLCHEVGHHVDWYNRFWSKANSRQIEEFADQYAFAWGPLTAVTTAPDFIT